MMKQEYVKIIFGNRAYYFTYQIWFNEVSNMTLEHSMSNPMALLRMADYVVDRSTNQMVKCRSASVETVLDSFLFGE